mgnify:CR=1 FL=1
MCITDTLKKRQQQKKLSIICISFPPTTTTPEPHHGLSWLWHMCPCRVLSGCLLNGWMHSDPPISQANPAPPLFLKCCCFPGQSLCLLFPLIFFLVFCLPCLWSLSISFLFSVLLSAVTLKFANLTPSISTIIFVFCLIFSPIPFFPHFVLFIWIAFSFNV